MTAWWNHRLCALGFNEIDECIGIVALVGDDALRLNPLDKGRRFGYVGRLPAGQAYAQGIVKGFDRRMNLGAQAPPAASDGLIARFWGAPVACWGARTMVESTNNCSRSVSRLSARPSAPKPRSCSSGKSAYTLCAKLRSAGAGRATASPCGRSTTPRRQSVDCRVRSPRAYWPCLSTAVRYASIDRRATSSRPFSQTPKSENVYNFVICDSH